MGVDIYPPSQPSGMTLAYTEINTNQTGISTETDLTGLTATVTVPAGRRIRITAQIQMQSATTSGTVVLRIKEGAVVFQTSQENYNTIGGNGKYIDATAIIIPTAGTHTYKLSLQGTAGTVDTSAAVNFILVEDITGTIYPAGVLVTAGIIASEQWTDWVPVLTNLTLGNGTLLGKYMKTGRTVDYRFRFVLGTTSAVGSDPSFTLPFTPAADYLSPADSAAIGMIHEQDSGGSSRMGMLWLTGASSGRIISYSTTGLAVATTATVPFTWGTSDSIFAWGTYEAVS